MRRPAVLCALALLSALVAVAGTAGAAFTTHESNPQTITAGVIEEPVQLAVQSKSLDGGAGNQVDYGLRLQNRGSEGIDLTRVKMRYWFTVDGFSASPVTACDFSSFGCYRINQRAVDLPDTLDRADHYVEFSFDNGSVGPNQPVSLEDLAIRDPFGGNYHEDNDYSFLVNASFTDNPRVTAYIDGKLVWGTEPAPVPRVESVEVQYANLDLDPDSTDPNINFNLKVLNTGTVDLAAGRLTVRYWFTRDGGTSPLVSNCDYAEIGCSKFLTSFGSAQPPKPTADRYLTVTFNSILEAGGNAGQIHLRVHKADFAPFNESNDYSRNTNSSLESSMRLTAYIDGRLVWGTPP